MATVMPDYVLALFAGAEYRWNPEQPLGSAASLTYSFMEQVPVGAETGDDVSFEPMSAAQRALAKEALALWAKVANLTFTEVPDNNGIGGTLQFGTNRPADPDTTAYAYFPQSGASAGDIYVSNADPRNADPQVGTYGFATLIHEIGHALGIKHPAAYGDGDIGPYLPVETESEQYTVMSYTPSPNGMQPSTPMLYDIAVIQSIYGANMSTGAGNDEYTFTNAVKAESIWDAGGIDTFNFTQVTGYGLIVSLKEGVLSCYGSDAQGGQMLGNLSIAYGAVIENVLGTELGDTIGGNTADNSMRGNGGNDWLRGDEGNDAVYGNQGDDIVYGNGGLDILFGGQGVDTVIGGRDNDAAYGNLQNDTVYGNLGDDLLFGGQGDDLLFGGAGNDTLYGNAGNDTLNGNRDADLFVIGGGGDDVIVGFTADDGDRLSLGAHAVGANDAGDVVLTLDAGGTVTLVGITAFDAGWIV